MVSVLNGDAKSLPPPPLLWKSEDSLPVLTLQGGDVPSGLVSPNIYSNKWGGVKIIHDI